MNKSTSQRFSSPAPLPKATSWIVEDDISVASSLKEMFRISGTETSIFDNGHELLAAFESGTSLPDIICLDLTLPDIAALDLIPSIKKVSPQVPVVVITANRSPEIIEQATELGVYDYLPKNADQVEFASTVKRALEYHNLHKQLDLARNQPAGMEKKQGEPPAYVWLRDSGELRSIAVTDVPVLLSGESGTGKEVLSHMVHMLSPRNQQPFVKVQCAGLGLEEIERELFGHEANVFSLPDGLSGALERADGGTLLIENIEELELSIQARLFRFLTLKRFTRVGSMKELQSHCRIIVTTECDLMKEVNEHRFRKNLFYQLAVAEIDLQPLRNRTNDIITLAEHFVRQFCYQFNKRLYLSGETREILMNYSWPGNIRELRNVNQGAIIQCNETSLDVCHLPERIRNYQGMVKAGVQRAEAVPTDSDSGTDRSGGSIEEQEKRLILESLQRTGGNISQAALLLGISRATLYRKLQKFKILKGATVSFINTSE